MRGTSANRALIVDGDRWRCDVVSQLLVQAGYVVACASNGFTGLRLAERERPNLILLGPNLVEVGNAPLLLALRTGRFTRGIPVLLGVRLAEGLDGNLRADCSASGPPVAAALRAGSVARTSHCSGVRTWHQGRQPAVALHHSHVHAVSTNRRQKSWPQRRAPERGMYLDARTGEPRPSSVCPTPADGRPSE